MRVNETTRRALAVRRQRRDLVAQGYEEVGEGGGRLWELERGGRIGHRITDAIIAIHGRSVYVKIESTGRMATDSLQPATRASQRRPIYKDEDWGKS